MILRSFSNFLRIIAVFLICLPSKGEEKIDIWNNNNKKPENPARIDTDQLKKRANKMGINDLDKKYKLNEIIKGDSLFCATGITKGDLVNGLELRDNKMVTSTLITHKSQNTKKIITGEIDIKK